MPKALLAASSDLEFRRGLPLGYLRQAGLGRPGLKATPHRKDMKKTLKDLVGRLVKFVDLDVAVDEMGKQMMHDALPPVLSQGRYVHFHSFITDISPGLYLIGCSMWLHG